MNSKPCRWIEPYSDDYMTFNEVSGHYVLTEKALTEYLGIDFRSRLAETSAVTPEAMINNYLRTVSDMIYEYIHQFNSNNASQDCLIAHNPTLRRIIFEAMSYQAQYVAYVGNLYNSLKQEDRACAIDHLAQSKLATVVPELGFSIIYGGAY